MFRFQRFLPNSLRMRFLLVSSLIFQLAKAFLDTEDKSWLVYLTYDDPNKWPMNTFDQRNCSVPPTHFEGCHGVLVDPRVVLTTRSCLGRQQSRKNNLYVVQNAFDQGFARSRGQARRIDPKIAFPPLKYCNNDGVACERDLAMVRFSPALPNAQVLPIAPDSMLKSDANNDLDCRVFGWGVWGKVKEGNTPWQMFSTPIKTQQPYVCRQSFMGNPMNSDGGSIRQTDLCLDNSAGDICPQNADGAPVVCQVAGLDYLVGMSKKRSSMPRPVPIVATNVPEYIIDDETFLQGFLDDNQDSVDPGLREEGHSNAKIFRANLLLIFGLLLIN